MASQLTAMSQRIVFTLRLEDDGEVSYLGALCKPTVPLESAEKLPSAPVGQPASTPSLTPEAAAPPNSEHSRDLGPVQFVSEQSTNWGRSAWWQGVPLPSQLPALPDGPSALLPVSLAARGEIWQAQQAEQQEHDVKKAADQCYDALRQGLDEEARLESEAAELAKAVAEMRQPAAKP